jgi:hypothetical protein
MGLVNCPGTRIDCAVHEFSSAMPPLCQQTLLIVHNYVVASTLLRCFFFYFRFMNIPCTQFFVVVAATVAAAKAGLLPRGRVYVYVRV